MVEAINDNDSVVRRGTSQEIVIRGGEDNPANIAINNVPIFANVRDGATVNAGRFVPKVFAPGITFELSDTVLGETNLLQDVTTNEASFSVSVDDASVKPIYIARLDAGEHQLTVRDPRSGESTSITMTVLDSQKHKVLPSTAGAYVGSPSSRGTESLSNMLLYYSLTTK